jgi:hypothetical protein
MTKDAGILVAIPPDLKEWVDAQAEDIGVNAAIWIRMLVFAARKGRAAPIGQPAAMPAIAWTLPATQPAAWPVDPGQAGQPHDLDDWRGPADDAAADAAGVDVDAIIAARVAEADAAGLTAQAQPYEAFAAGPPQQAVPAGNVRSLRRPAPLYSPATQGRLSGLL